MELTKGTTVNIWIIKHLFNDVGTGDFTFAEIKKDLESDYAKEVGWDLLKKYRGLTFAEYVEKKRIQLAHIYGCDDLGRRLYGYEVEFVLYDPDFDEEPESYSKTILAISEEEAIRKLDNQFANCCDYQGIINIERR